jgi:molecular chaperone DnaK
VRNQLDSLVYSTEKTFEENKEKLGPESKGELETALAEAKKALESEDLDTMKRASGG